MKKCNHSIIDGKKIVAIVHRNISFPFHINDYKGYGIFRCTICGKMMIKGKASKQKGMFGWLLESLRR